MGAAELEASVYEREEGVGVLVSFKESEIEVKNREQEP